MLFLLTHDFLEISGLWDEKTIGKQTSAVFPNDFFVPVRNNLLKKEQRG